MHDGGQDASSAPPGRRGRHAARATLASLAAILALAGLLCATSSLRAGTLYTKDNAPAAPKIEDLEKRKTVTQYGITWTFDRAVPVGRFVTGDWYVVGPVTVVAIDPKPLLGDDARTDEDRERADGKYARNGLVLNLPLNARAGFDSRDSHASRVPRANRYDPDQFRSPPVALKPGDCLLSSISVEKVGVMPVMLEGARRQSASPVRTVAALTCLAQPVPADAFRPSYGDRSQKIYLARNLRRDLLPRLARSKAGVGRRKDDVVHRVNLSRWDVTELANWQRVFQRPWIDTVLDQLLNPVENMPNYGANIGRAAGIATLLLCCDYAPQEKEPVLLAVVQVGVDLWGLVRAGHAGWPALGGHGIGRKWIIVFSGLMLGDADMQQPAKKYPGARFGEDMQTAYGPCWTGARVVYAGHTGKEGHPRHEGWGAYEHLPPEKWISQTGESYRRCCTAIAWVGQALAIRVLHAEKAWDHPAFLDYCDRWMYEDDAEHVKRIKEARGWDFSAEWALQRQTWDVWVNDMWATYRPTLQPPPDGWKQRKDDR